MANAISKLLVEGLLAGLLAAPPVSAQSAGKLLVCVNSPDYASLFVMNRAEIVASQMFSTASVALQWHSARTAACQKAHLMQSVTLDFVSGTPPDEHPGALAYAQLSEVGHVVVLYDRIQKCVSGPTQSSDLLAHVMTHEITHILQGVARHSQTGVMRAHWDQYDFAKMARKPLPFEPEDIDLMQRGMRLRAAAPASAVAPATGGALR